MLLLCIICFTTVVGLDILNTSLASQVLLINHIIRYALKNIQLILDEFLIF